MLGDLEAIARIREGLIEGAVLLNRSGFRSSLVSRPASNVNAFSSGELVCTPLHLAAADNNLELVKLLVEKGLQEAIALLKQLEQS